MAVITPFSGVLPNKGQSVTEFNANVKSFLAYIASLGPDINTAIAEILVGANVTVWTAGVYNPPTIVAGSDGNRYACVATTISGDNPVTSVTGHWVQITLDSADLFPPISAAVPIENDIRGGDITVSGNVLTITPCSCKDSTGQIALLTGANKTVTLPSSGNTQCYVFLVKLVADGSCEFRQYSSENFTDTQVSAFRMIAPWRTNAAATANKGVMTNGFVTFAVSLENIIATTGTSYATVDHSVCFPVSRIAAIRYGAKEPTYGMASDQISISEDGTEIIENISTNSSGGSPGNWGALSKLYPFNANRKFKSGVDGKKLLCNSILVRR